MDTESFPVRTRQDDTVITSYVRIQSFPVRTKQDDAVISSYVYRDRVTYLKKRSA